MHSHDEQQPDSNRTAFDSGSHRHRKSDWQIQAVNAIQSHECQFADRKVQLLFEKDSRLFRLVTRGKEQTTETVETVGIDFLSIAAIGNEHGYAIESTESR